jgi:hypothetical protein
LLPVEVAEELTRVAEALVEVPEAIYLALLMM